MVLSTLWTTRNRCWETALFPRYFFASRLLIIIKIDLRICSKTVNILFALQKPFAGKGSKTWTQKAEYPGWAVFVVVMMVLVSTLPILIWLIKDWPKNWRASFHRTFISGLNNYLPDPLRQETPEAPHNGMKNNYAIDGGHVWSVKECH